MMLLRPLTIIFYAVVFASGAASGEVVMKAVDDQVSFRPVEPLPSPVTSIIWKHQTRDGTVVKAIEWEFEQTKLNGETTILNPRFKGVTSVDVKTGEITITNLKHEHSGDYFMEINSKEQEQRFTLTVKDPVPKPEINIVRLDNPDVVYLNCEYGEPIIWKNSAGETLPGSPIGGKIGKSITVEKALETNPEKFYTCTLDNGASKKTSDPVYVKDLFKDPAEPHSPHHRNETGIAINEDGSQGSYLWLLIFPVIIIFVVMIVLYIRNKDFKKRVDGCCPCKVKGKEKNPEETPAVGGKQNNSAVPSQSNDHMATENETETNLGKEKNSEETPYKNETETDPETVPLKNK